MNIPPKYEDVVAQLEAERVRADVAVADCNDAERREAALREELKCQAKITIDGCIFEGQNPDGSEVFEFEKDDSGISRLKYLRMVGWRCYGGSAENIHAHLQSRCAAAEQRVAELTSFIDDVVMRNPLAKIH